MKEYSFYLTAGNNAFDPMGATEGYRLYPSGAVSRDYGANISGFMPYSAPMWFPLVDGTDGITVCYYDKEQAYITGEDLQEARFTAMPQGAAYIRVSAAASYWDDIELTDAIPVVPLYSDSLSKDYEKESSQQFFRVKLNGKLTFVGDGYDYIDAAPFDTVYHLAIFRNGESAPYMTGTFMKTDGTWNADNKTCEVELTTQDGYTDITAGMENKYDLIELASEIEACTVFKRPLLQVYLPGEDSVTNVLGKVWWEEEVTEAVDVDLKDMGRLDLDTLISTYKFTISDIYMSIRVDSAPNGYLNALGLYWGKMKLTMRNSWMYYSGTLTKRDGSGYSIDFDYSWVSAETGSPCTITLKDASGNEIAFNTSPSEPFADGDLLLYGDYGKVEIYKKTYAVYTRLLLDVDTYPLASGDHTTSDVPSDDFTGNTQNYSKAVGVELGILNLDVSDETQAEPTQWGKAANGEYFVQPYGYDIPLMKITWTDFSLWLNSAIYTRLDAPGRKPYTLKNAYPLSSCINVLLHEIAPSLTHEPTEEYSKFLYAIDNPISGIHGATLLITPKSNILKGEYDQPAQKATVTLKQITDMLRDCFRCYWYVDGGKFKVEHIEYFRNGLSYDSNTHNVGVDITRMMNPRNGKDWGYCTSEWKFEKVQMPERYQFGWMDEVTKPFEGEPMEITSPYVEKGLTEEVTVGNFTSDIDYMLISPGEISEDGFALLWAYGMKPVNINRRYSTKVNPDTGAIENDNAYFTTMGIIGGVKSGINVVPGQKYLLSKAYPGAWYDYDGAFISGYDPASSELGKPVTLTAPDGALYYVATFKTGEEETSTVTPQQYELPIGDAEPPQGGKIMQNNLLAFPYLQQAFYVYDLPAGKAVINGVETVAKGIARNKTQVVSVPLAGDPDMQELVRTHIGDGQIDKASINLSSRMAKLTLRYDIEQ